MVKDIMVWYYISTCLFATSNLVVFTEDGFDNWRKATGKFNDHKYSHCHAEASDTFKSMKESQCCCTTTTYCLNRKSNGRKSVEVPLSVC